jgi:hypothetical protein
MNQNEIDPLEWHLHSRKLHVMVSTATTMYSRSSTQPQNRKTGRSDLLMAKKSLQSLAEQPPPPVKICTSKPHCKRALTLTKIINLVSNC